jgi:DnaJ-class molecular chaperone
VHKTGDLYINFNIKFPKNLTLVQKEKMLKVLRGEDEETTT